MKDWEQARDEALADLERTHSADQYFIMLNKMADFGREWTLERLPACDYSGVVKILQEENTKLKERNKELEEAMVVIKKANKRSIEILEGK